MVKLPAGTTIICGHRLHSWNVSFGFSACSCVANSGVTVIDDNLPASHAPIAPSSTTQTNDPMSKAGRDLFHGGSG